MKHTQQNEISAGELIGTTIPSVVFKCKKERVLEIFPKAATGCILKKKVFLNISPISQENTYVGVSF